MAPTSWQACASHPPPHPPSPRRSSRTAAPPRAQAIGSLKRDAAKGGLYLRALRLDRLDDADSESRSQLWALEVEDLWRAVLAPGGGGGGGASASEGVLTSGRRAGSVSTITPSS